MRWCCQQMALILSRLRGFWGLFTTSGMRGHIHPAVVGGTKKVLSRRPLWTTQFSGGLTWEAVVLASDDGDHKFED